MDCLFCKIISKEIPSNYVYETSDFVVIPDIHPQAPIHLLILPKVHYGEFLDMPQSLLTALTELTKKIIHDQQIVQYRLVNNGKGAAFIDHFHLHILGKISKDRGL